MSPDVPADWNRLSLTDVRVGSTMLLMNFTRAENTLILEVGRTEGSDDCIFEYRPAISLRARVLKVELNGQPVKFKVEQNESDQHVLVRIPIGTGKHFIRIFLAND